MIRQPFHILSWHEWSINPINRHLVNTNLREAQRQYMIYRIDEEERTTRILAEIAAAESVSAAVATGGGGAGGGWDDTAGEGVGSWAIGTYLTPEGDQTNNPEEAADGGYNRFIIS